MFIKENIEKQQTFQFTLNVKHQLYLNSALHSLFIPLATQTRLDYAISVFKLFWEQKQEEKKKQQHKQCVSDSTTRSNKQFCLKASYYCKYEGIKVLSCFKHSRTVICKSQESEVRHTVEAIKPKDCVRTFSNFAFYAKLDISR
ncbi:CLUMA_CG002051, isoform A [Clunio marinus]|uniref:CLUMA_CG002051, isoform A n=1 Tax=Clunio marinus TaxID=568069 RepID=A0A1J1HJQ5_9DIPT|nr:CLUMA_CG002051, isoform A [Clunio marinus]